MCVPRLVVNKVNGLFELLLNCDVHEGLIDLLVLKSVLKFKFRNIVNKIFVLNRERSRDFLFLHGHFNFV